MNYNRFLDLHLCTNGGIGGITALKTAIKPSLGDQRFFSHRGTEYFYDFEAKPSRISDLESQRMNRLGKIEGYGDGNSKILREVEVTRSQKSLLQFTNGTISKELEQLRYLGCLVAIEHLQDGNVYPQLQALMSWISDASTINKLRVNCHGGGISTQGFLMGKADLTPDQLVGALVRHGLTRAGRANEKIGGMTHAARWKHDDEVTKCEDCNTPFQKTWYGSSSKHHCRRCGGIFCEGCSARRLDLDVALAGPDKPPVKPFKQARVCNNCYDTVMASKTTNKIASLGLKPSTLGNPSPKPSANLDKYGLQTFTLACCMGAKSDTSFSNERSRTAELSPAEAYFVGDSLAGRVIAALRQNNLLGIKVTASNQLVANSSSGSGFSNSLTITYPGGAGTTVSLDQGEALIPAVVWGLSRSQESRWNGLTAETRPVSGEIKVGLLGKDLEFGGVDVQSGHVVEQIATLRTYYGLWKFRSWICSEDVCFSQVTRRAISSKTLRLKPPFRIDRIESTSQGGRQCIKVIGRARGLEMVKWFKSYETS
jgi:hypothetical protein